MSTTGSIEILTPVIDLSDDDDDDDINQTDIECRYSVTRRSGLFVYSLHVEQKKPTTRASPKCMPVLSDSLACVDFSHRKTFDLIKCLFLRL